MCSIPCDFPHKKNKLTQGLPFLQDQSPSTSITMKCNPYFLSAGLFFFCGRLVTVRSVCRCDHVLTEGIQEAERVQLPHWSVPHFPLSLPLITRLCQLSHLPQRTLHFESGTWSKGYL